MAKISSGARLQACNNILLTDGLQPLRYLSH